MRAFILIPLLIALSLLGACDTFKGASEPARLLLKADTPEKQQEAALAVIEDLREALRSAEVHEDKIAAACWRGILARFDRIEGSYFTNVQGAASGLQKARNIRRIATNMSEDIQIACAALRADVRSNVLGVFNLVGLPVP